MKVLIADPGLHSMGGHHYNAVQRLMDELAAPGFETRCFGAAQADPHTMHTLACRPVFSRSVYWRRYHGNDEFDAAVRATARELFGALRATAFWPDLVVLPSCDQVLAAALAKGLRRHPLRRPPALLMWLLYAPHRHRLSDDPTASRQAEECRAAFARLSRSVGHDQITVCCETDALAGFYGRLLAMDVRVLPGPGPAMPTQRRSATTGGRVLIVCAGFANRAKGYHLLPEAIARVLRQRDVRFLVHGIVDGTDSPEGHSTFGRLRQLGERVITTSERLQTKQYREMLAEADLVLMPYDPDAYRERGSGLLAEAQALGVPVVAPQAAAFARPAFHCGWGVPIREHSAAGVAGAVVEACDRLDELRGRLEPPQDRLSGLLREVASKAGSRPAAGTLGRLASRLLGR
jgi:glycosyltransferase involved in cell wall biosynthesis